jgi:hypothetical protein
MIQQKTVLVLGAGASIPFGFPSGYELVQQVCASHFYMRLTKFGIPSGEANKFCNALRQSGKQSVDTFLEHRPDLLEVGKLAIAVALIPCEQTHRLFNKGGAPTWYDYLWDKMNAPFEKLEANNLVVLTFNYDRSLEQYLFKAVQKPL